MRTKFSIPPDARKKYPICEKSVEELNTHSWFKATGINPVSDASNANTTVIRCKQIRVIPNAAQKKLLSEWFNIYRYAYNCTVKEIRRNGLEKFRILRPIVKGSFPEEIIRRQQACRIPVHTIDNAIKDAVLAYETSFALHKGKKTFRIRFKKAKANQTIALEASAFSKVRNSFSQKLGVIQTSESIIGIKKTCRLSLKDGTYTLFRPVDVLVKQSITESEVCSLDPGLRTFQTVYCNDGKIYEIGIGVQKRLAPLIKKSKIGKSRHRKRIRDKVKHLVDDLHWKSASILRKLADRLLIGNMSTIGVLQGNLRSSTKQLMQAVSHYTFRQRLGSKCQEYNIIFNEVDESYTSKTCGMCGKLNDSLGSSKNFNCLSCGFKVDRDVNGARNIMIKHLQ